MSYHISILVLEHCMAANVISPIDLFCTANRIFSYITPQAQPLFEVELVSLVDEPVKSMSGYYVMPHKKISTVQKTDIIMIPAFMFNDPDHLGDLLQKWQSLVDWLRDCYQAGTVIASSCSGAFLLAETGLLTQKSATTSWWLAELFSKRYPNIKLKISSLLIENDRLICTGAAMSFLDLTLHLVRRFGSEELANACAKYLILDQQRQLQAPYIMLNQWQAKDPLIAKAEQWLRQHIGKSVSIQVMADELALSQRTLIRRFKEITGDSPQVFLQKFRVEMSKRLLETTKLPLKAIIQQIGYKDIGAFRKLFKKYTCLSPSEYRLKFGIYTHHE